MSSSFGSKSLYNTVWQLSPELENFAGAKQLFLLLHFGQYITNASEPKIVLCS